MVDFTAVQKKVVTLKDEAVAAVESGKLQPFFHGRVPCFDHYKRLTMPPKKAVSTAMYGYMMCKKVLNVDLYFTQALVIGAYLLATHSNIRVILPSQYGKSFMAACAGLVTAFSGQDVSVSANDTPLTKKIMSEVFNIVPSASLQLKHKLLTPPTELDRLQRSLSKSKLGFVGGGSLSAITLGGSFSDSMRSNQAIGQSGNYIIDESALVPDTNYAETGRSEFGVRADGHPYVSLEISNPHQINHFYRSMTADPIPPGHLVVWGDIRVSIEEGAYLIAETDPHAPALEDTKFYANDGTCKKYLLCDFGGGSEDNFFSTSPVVNNQPLPDDTECVLGLDSATRGADSIMGALLALPTFDRSKVTLCQLHDFKPTEWIDFVSPKRIAVAVADFCVAHRVRAIVMDLGGGEVLFDHIGNELRDRRLKIGLKGVYFNSSPTPSRRHEGFTGDDGKATGADLGVNKRAEMYLDFREMLERHQMVFAEQCVDVIAAEMSATGPAKEVGNGRIQLQDKSKYVKKRLGHSPDALDACVMAVHAFLLDRLGMFTSDGWRLYEAIVNG